MEETRQYPQKIENQGIVYQDRNQKVEKIIAKFENFEKSKTCGFLLEFH